MLCSAHAFLMSGGRQPYSDDCLVPLTVRHLLVECLSLKTFDSGVEVEVEFFSLLVLGDKDDLPRYDANGFLKATSVCKLV